MHVVGKRGVRREPPHGMQAQLSAGVAPFVRVKIRLPGREPWIDLGNLPIVNEEVELPLTLCFLCHAEEDEDSVAAVGNQLESDGIVTWFAPKSIVGGANWKLEIENAIEAADFVVIFLSVASINKRGYYQREVKRAFELREELPDGERFIVPVLLEDCTPPKRYKDIHWIKLYQPVGYDELRKTLRDLSVPGNV